MTFRTLCFGGAVLTEGTVRWSLLAGSLILPWVAVVLANASRENSALGAEYFQGMLEAATERDTKR